MKIYSHKYLVSYFTVLVALCNFVTVHSEPLTLKQAIGLAHKGHPAVQQYRERLEERKLEDRVALGRFLPTIRLDGSYNHLNDPLEFDLSPIRSAMIQLQASNQVEFTNIGKLLASQPALTPAQRQAVYQQAFAQLDAAIPRFVDRIKQQDYKTLAVVGVQPLFTGGKIVAGKRYAHAERKFAEAELTKVDDEVLFETVRNYLAVLLLQDVVKVRADVLDGMNRHRSDAGKLFQEGLIARAQLLRAEVAVADAERNLSDDRNRLELARTALRLTVQYSNSDVIELSDTLHPAMINDSLARFLTLAERNQPLLQMIDAKQSSAKTKIVADRADMLPTVAAFGKYETYPQYQSSLDPRWVIGIQASITLFDGLQSYHRTQSDRHLTREVAAMRADASRKVKLWVEQTYRKLRDAEYRYRKQEANVALAEESLRQNEKRFQSGMVPSLEVIDARLSYEKNRLERLQSLYDWNVSMTELYVAAGIPSEMITVWQNGEVGK